MSRLPVHTVNIPSRHPAPPLDSIPRTPKTVVALLQSCDVDPRKASEIQMVIWLCQSYVARETSEAEFRHCMKNVLVLNPGIRTYPPPSRRRMQQRCNQEHE